MEEVEEAVEAMCSSMSREEVASILDLEDQDAMAAACPESFETLARLVETWGGEEVSLVLTAERVRGILASVAAAVSSSERGDRWVAAAVYAQLVAMEGSPVSLANPGVLRLLSREFEGNGERKRKKRRRSSESSSSSEHDTIKTSRDEAFRLLAGAVASENWKRMQAELARCEQTALIGRLASCFAAGLEGEALKSMLRSDCAGAALEALVEPLAGGASAVFDAVAACEDEAALLGLRQRLCVLASSLTAAARLKVVQIVVRLPGRPEALAAFARRLAACSCPSRRAIGVEVLLRGFADDAVEVAVARANDKSPLVRARVLAALAATAPREDLVVAEVAAERARYDREDKPTVRAKATQLLEKLPATPTSIAAAVAGASDPSPSVRLAAASALGRWLACEPDSPELREAWSTRGLALALDVSPAVVAKVAARVEAVFLATDDANTIACARACAAVVARSARLRRCLRAAFRAAMRTSSSSSSAAAKVATNKKIRGVVEATLSLEVANPALAPGLAVLEEALSARDNEEEGEVEEDWAFRAMDVAESTTRDDETCASALRVAAALATNDRRLAARLEALPALDLGYESIPALVRARSACGRATTSAWVDRLLETAGNVLVQGRDDPQRALRVIGALAACVDDDDSLSRATSLVAALATPSSRRGEPVSDPAARRCAFAALAHVCASSDGRLAKLHVPTLAREIHASDDPGIRSTCLVAVAELCVEHASLVAPRLGAVFRALTCDPDDSVRRHAIVLVSRLLARDYVKWRVELAHRFFAATADDHDVNADLARTALVDALLPKHPTLVVNHFVAAIFVLNGARLGQDDADVAEIDRDSYHLVRAATSAIGILDDEGGRSSSSPRRFERDLADKFSLHPHRRRRVYKTLLAATPDEGKIQVAAKLARDVLASAADNLLGNLVDPHNSPANVVADALALLSSDLKVTSSSSSSSSSGTGGDDDDPDDPDDDPANTSGGAAGGPRPRQVKRVLAAARGRLLSKMSKRHLLEQILPILISLKSNLEHHKSPILADLMACLRDVLRTYGPDVDAVLSQDPHLAAELKYDLARAAKSAAADDATPQ
ncbi:hypothetical protein CTAYLR_008079 [Chrysophaeum taylorii]|uniref:Condensin complex subunit 1 C-terminal domain-containing protein n=1 Tax=Chrysophaeum taylorii TaxID=2483200 RepID=A0AAD7ULR3_9STRA|nr:hypothetical protein CTAYLR_008079 [Chrysophaeum taylorii]